MTLQNKLKELCKNLDKSQLTQFVINLVVEADLTFEKVQALVPGDSNTSQEARAKAISELGDVIKAQEQRVEKYQRETASKDYDADFFYMLSDDLSDYENLLSYIDRGMYLRAQNRMHRMDTAPREEIPLSTWNYIEAMAKKKGDRK